MKGILTDAFAFTVLLQTAPLLLAALGGMFSQQANILNIALEGMMLMGAFTSIAVGAASGNAAVAVIAAIGAALVISVIFAWVSLFMGADFIIVGIGIGTLTSGVSVLLLKTFYHSEGSYAPPNFPHLWKLRLGPLRHVPVIGPALQGQSILVVLALLLVPASSWVLFRTRYGLRVRAVGEEEAAVVAAGLRPRTIKLTTVLISGALCGIAGAQLAMATLDQFVSNMTAGRGFIALAAIFVGRARPLGTLIGCLVFGFASALATQLQLAHYPSDLMLMLPYVVTVVVLLGRPAVRLVRQRRRAANASLAPAAS
jgi:simple sugar transport system permease protein